MMLLAKARSDVMFAHYAVRRNIILAVNITAAGNIICPQGQTSFSVNAPLRASRYRRSAFCSLSFVMLEPTTVICNSQLQHSWNWRGELLLQFSSIEGMRRLTDEKRKRASMTRCGVSYLQPTRTYCLNKWICLSANLTNWKQCLRGTMLMEWGLWCDTPPSAEHFSTRNK